MLQDRPSPSGRGSWTTGARPALIAPGRGRGQALACSPASEWRRPLDPAAVGREGGGVGVGAFDVPSGDPQASQKNALKPWQKKEWWIPKVSADFVACDFVANMEDVLDLYAEPYDPQRPVVCFDETSTQLLAETRPSLPSRPGLPLRQDYEYRREGTRNLFLACEPLAGWRHVAVTGRRTMQDFAHQMRWLVDEPTRRSRRSRVVLDNLNTHRPTSL